MKGGAGQQGSMPGKYKEVDDLAKKKGLYGVTGVGSEQGRATGFNKYKDLDYVASKHGFQLSNIRHRDFPGLISAEVVTISQGKAMEGIRKTDSEAGDKRTFWQHVSLSEERQQKTSAKIEFLIAKILVEYRKENKDRQAPFSYFDSSLLSNLSNRVLREASLYNLHGDDQKDQAKVEAFRAVKNSEEFKKAITEVDKIALTDVQNGNDLMVKVYKIYKVMQPFASYYGEGFNSKVLRFVLVNENMIKNLDRLTLTEKQFEEGSDVYRNMQDIWVRGLWERAGGMFDRFASYVITLGSRHESRNSFEHTLEAMAKKRKINYTHPHALVGDMMFDMFVKPTKSLDESLILSRKVMTGMFMCTALRYDSGIMQMFAERKESPDRMEHIKKFFTKISNDLSLKDEPFDQCLTTIEDYERLRATVKGMTTAPTNNALLNVLLLDSLDPLKGFITDFKKFLTDPTKQQNFVIDKSKLPIVLLTTLTALYKNEQQLAQKEKFGNLADAKQLVEQEKTYLELQVAFTENERELKESMKRDYEKMKRVVEQRIPEIRKIYNGRVAELQIARVMLDEQELAFNSNTARIKELRDMENPDQAEIDRLTQQLPRAREDIIKSRIAIRDLDRLITYDQNNLEDNARFTEGLTQEISTLEKKITADRASESELRVKLERVARERKAKRELELEKIEKIKKRHLKNAERMRAKQQEYDQRIERSQQLAKQKLKEEADVELTRVAHDKEAEQTKQEVVVKNEPVDDSEHKGARPKEYGAEKKKKKKKTKGATQQTKPQLVLDDVADFEAIAVKSPYEVHKYKINNIPVLIPKTMTDDDIGTLKTIIQSDRTAQTGTSGRAPVFGDVDGASSKQPYLFAQSHNKFFPAVVVSIENPAGGEMQFIVFDDTSYRVVDRNAHDKKYQTQLVAMVNNAKRSAEVNFAKKTDDIVDFYLANRAQQLIENIRSDYNDATKGNVAFSEEEVLARLNQLTLERQQHARANDNALSADADDGAVGGACASGRTKRSLGGRCLRINGVDYNNVDTQEEMATLSRWKIEEDTVVYIDSNGKKHLVTVDLEDDNVVTHKVQIGDRNVRLSELLDGESLSSIKTRIDDLNERIALKGSLEVLDKIFSFSNEDIGKLNELTDTLRAKASEVLAEAGLSDDAVAKLMKRVDVANNQDMEGLNRLIRKHISDKTDISQVDSRLRQYLTTDTNGKPMLSQGNAKMSKFNIVNDHIGKVGTLMSLIGTINLISNVAKGDHSSDAMTNLYSSISLTDNTLDTLTNVIPTVKTGKAMMAVKGLNGISTVVGSIANVVAFLQAGSMQKSEMTEAEFIQSNVNKWNAYIGTGSMALSLAGIPATALLPATMLMQFGIHVATSIKQADIEISNDRSMGIIRTDSEMHAIRTAKVFGVKTHLDENGHAYLDNGELISAVLLPMVKILTGKSIGEWFEGTDEQNKDYGNEISNALFRNNVQTLQDVSSHLNSGTCAVAFSPQGVSTKRVLYAAGQSGGDDFNWKEQSMDWNFQSSNKDLDVSYQNKMITTAEEIPMSQCPPTVVVTTDRKKRSVGRNGYYQGRADAAAKTITREIPSTNMCVEEEPWTTQGVPPMAKSLFDSGKRMYSAPKHRPALTGVIHADQELTAEERRKAESMEDYDAKSFDKCYAAGGPAASMHCSTVVAKNGGVQLNKQSQLYKPGEVIILGTEADIDSGRLASGECSVLVIKSEGEKKITGFDKYGNRMFVENGEYTGGSKNDVFFVSQHNTESEIDGKNGTDFVSMLGNSDGTTKSFVSLGKHSSVLSSQDGNKTKTVRAKSIEGYYGNKGEDNVITEDNATFIVDGISGNDFTVSGECTDSKNKKQDQIVLHQGQTHVASKSSVFIADDNVRNASIINISNECGGGEIVVFTRGYNAKDLEYKYEGSTKKEDFASSNAKMETLWKKANKTGKAPKLSNSDKECLLITSKDGKMNLRIYNPNGIHINTGDNKILSINEINMRHWLNLVKMAKKDGVKLDSFDGKTLAQYLVKASEQTTTSAEEALETTTGVEEVLETTTTQQATTSRGNNDGSQQNHKGGNMYQVNVKSMQQDQCSNLKHSIEHFAETFPTNPSVLLGNADFQCKNTRHLRNAPGNNQHIIPLSYIDQAEHIVIDKMDPADHIILVNNGYFRLGKSPVHDTTITMSPSTPDGRKRVVEFHDLEFGLNHSGSYNDGESQEGHEYRFGAKDNRSQVKIKAERSNGDAETETPFIINGVSYEVQRSSGQLVQSAIDPRSVYRFVPANTSNSATNFNVHLNPETNVHMIDLFGALDDGNVKLIHKSNEPGKNIVYLTIYDSEARKISIEIHSPNGIDGQYFLFSKNKGELPQSLSGNANYAIVGSNSKIKQLRERIEQYNLRCLNDSRGEDQIIAPNDYNYIVLREFINKYKDIDFRNISSIGDIMKADTSMRNFIAYQRAATIAYLQTQEELSGRPQLSFVQSSNKFISDITPSIPSTPSTPAPLSTKLQNRRKGRRRGGHQTPRSKNSSVSQQRKRNPRDLMYDDTTSGATPSKDGFVNSVSSMLYNFLYSPSEQNLNSPVEQQHEASFGDVPEALTNVKTLVQFNKPFKISDSEGERFMRLSKDNGERGVTLHEFKIAKKHGARFEGEPNNGATGSIDSNPLDVTVSEQYFDSINALKAQRQDLKNIQIVAFTDQKSQYEGTNVVFTKDKDFDPNNLTECKEKHWKRTLKNGAKPTTTANEPSDVDYVINTKDKEPCKYTNIIPTDEPSNGQCNKITPEAIFGFQKPKQNDMCYPKRQETGSSFSDACSRFAFGATDGVKESAIANTVQDLCAYYLGIPRNDKRASEYAKHVLAFIAPARSGATGCLYSITHLASMALKRMIDGKLLQCGLLKAEELEQMQTIDPNFMALMQYKDFITKKSEELIKVQYNGIDYDVPVSCICYYMIGKANTVNLSIDARAEENPCPVLPFLTKATMESIALDIIGSGCQIPSRRELNSLKASTLESIEGVETLYYADLKSSDGKTEDLIRKYLKTLEQSREGRSFNLMENSQAMVTMFEKHYSAVFSLVTSGVVSTVGYLAGSAIGNTIYNEVRNAIDKTLNSRRHPVAVANANTKYNKEYGSIPSHDRSGTINSDYVYNPNSGYFDAHTEQTPYDSDSEYFDAHTEQPRVGFGPRVDVYEIQNDSHRNRKISSSDTLHSEGEFNDGMNFSSGKDYRRFHESAHKTPSSRSLQQGVGSLVGSIGDGLSNSKRNLTSYTSSFRRIVDTIKRPSSANGFPSKY